MFLTDTLGVLKKKMPEWLLERAVEYLIKASDIAIRDNDYIPPRTQSDWSFKKLYNAVDKAIFTVSSRRDPLTLENVAAVITKRKLDSRYKSALAVAERMA